MTTELLFAYVFYNPATHTAEFAPYYAPVSFIRMWHLIPSHEHILKLDLADYEKKKDLYGRIHAPELALIKFV